MARAFYSVVQYCPDRFRSEAVNVGLVLLCLEPHHVRVKMTSNHDRVRKLFGIGKPDLKNLQLSTQGLASRIETSVAEFQTAEDLAAFAASRANDLRLTEPRLVKVDDIDADFERLFADLVYRDSTTAMLAKESPATLLPPELSEVFYRLQKEQRIWDPKPIKVPVLGRKLDVPYAYRNGVINLVQPQVFAGAKRAEAQAATLAINGNLISRHLIDGEQHKLIVISTQEDEKQAREIDEHIAPLFREYQVRLVRPQDAEDFASEVEKSAH
jgi:hypothetical protein